MTSCREAAYFKADEKDKNEWTAAKKLAHSFTASQSVSDLKICSFLMEEINRNLEAAKSEIWHGSPVWFIDENPVVGHSKLRNCIQLLFWSGQSFGEDSLKPVGKYKAAEVRYTETAQIDVNDLARWLTKSIEVQWDYKNIARRKGVLERLK